MTSQTVWLILGNANEDKGRNNRHQGRNVDSRQAKRWKNFASQGEGGAAKWKTTEESQDVIEHNGVSIGFPLSTILVRRVYMRAQMETESDVLNAIRIEAKILKYRSIEEYQKDKRSSSRKRMRRDTMFRFSRIAIRQNNRAAKLGVLGTISASDVAEVFSEAGNKCLRCGKKKSLSLDHVFPVSKGGFNVRSNLQCLCRSCNTMKMTNETDYRIN